MNVNHSDAVNTKINQLIADKQIMKSEENEQVIRYNILFDTKFDWLYVVRNKISNLWYLERKDEDGTIHNATPRDYEQFAIFTR